MKINVKSLTTVMSDKGLENIEMISVRPASSPRPRRWLPIRKCRKIIQSVRTSTEYYSQHDLDL